MSDWETPSGRLTDYRGTIIDAQWTLSEQGVLNGEFKIATDNPDLPEWTERYSTGRDQGWKTFDGGETVEGGKTGRFIASTGMGRFINHVKNCLAEPNDTPDDLNKKMQTLLGDSPRNIKVWIGTSWLFSEVDESFTNRQTQERVALFKNYPTEYLGKDAELSPVNDSPAATSPQGGETTSSSSITDGQVNGQDPLSVLPPESAAQLREQAKTLSHADWQDQILAAATKANLLPNSPEYGSLISAAVDEAGLYTQLKGE